jgi:hypothetical protein
MELVKTLRSAHYRVLGTPCRVHVVYRCGRGEMLRVWEWYNPAESVS